ncbi:hypothetical protein [Leucothrix arctica]|uniref:Uncharacterized protein n=1 Tax=Leucothrix arctica TaxID=1481894 RepID=A0A317C995_9GAMM|nr:hypothetical protein [Leucothrix arctica]PWQ94751.1 hypothetical protein DKT75_15815 [Leucothrix arctica]
MQTIKQETLTVTEANQALEVNYESGLWALIVKMMAYPELTFDAKKETIVFEGFVPFQELAKEWIIGINDGTYDVQQCQSCDAYFDINTAEGIYGKPEEFEEFICIPCADKMTAREYYQRFVERTV